VFFLSSWVGACECGEDAVYEDENGRQRDRGQALDGQGQVKAERLLDCATNWQRAV